jgi:hypothetical protein
MGLGDEWTSIVSGSVAKLNGMTVTWGTGAYLSGLDKTKHKLIVCTSTGSGLTVDHVYLADSTGTTWLDLTSIAAHTHSSSSDGGILSSIFTANPKIMDISLTKTQDLKKAQWIETVTSTGTVADDTDGTTGERSIKLLTGATSGSGSTISYPHLKLDFAGRAIFQTKVRFSATTALAYHAGVGADDVTAADSNTRKFQAEVCTVTNGNWWLRTANGSANSASDTAIAFTTNRTAVKIIHMPELGTPETDLQIDTGTVLQKTTNIPISTATLDNNLIKHSLKNSAAADKNLFTYGSRLRYTVSDNWV